MVGRRQPKTYISFVEGNRSFRAELPFRIFACFWRRQQLEKLERRHEVERIRIVVLGHVDCREVNLKIATARHVTDGQNIVGGWVAHAVSDEQRRLMRWSLENFQPGWVVAVAVSSLCIVLHLRFACSIARHHPMHDNPDTFVTLSLEAVDTTGKKDSHERLIMQHKNPKKASHFKFIAPLRPKKKTLRMLLNTIGSICGSIVLLTNFRLQPWSLSNGVPSWNRSTNS